MAKKRLLPELPETGRHYVENTQRARLASPGIERYAARRRRSGRIFLVLVLAAAIFAALRFLR
jgi:hypothetical protein